MADLILVQIVDKIIAILKAATSLSTIEDDNIVFGPPGIKDVYPYITVMWGSGPIDKIGFRDESWRQSFTVSVFHCIKENTSVAEKFVANAIVNAKTALDSDYTLGGLVKGSRTVFVRGEAVVNMTDYGHVNERIAGAELTLKVEHLTSLPQKT